MYIIYTKKERAFALHPDANVAALEVKLPAAFVREARNLTIETPEHIIGYTKPTKSNRGGLRPKSRLS